MERCRETECFIDRDHTISSTTPNELLAEICKLVDGLLAHDDCYLIIEALGTHRYLQALAKGGALYLESVSNESLGPTCASEHGLTAADHARLVRLGWLPPDDDSPNRHRDFREPWPWPASMVAELFVRTLVEVHDVSLDELELTMRHATRPGRQPVEAANRRAS